MKKRVLIVGGIFFLVALLAGAAFIGGRLVSGQGLAGLGSVGGLDILSNEAGGSSQHISIQTIPAKELPQAPADADGIFDHRKDNSIFVGTGQVRKNPQTDQSGNVATSLTHDGPTVEVVVTTQTLVYRDVTMEQFNGQRPSGTTNVQQVLEPSTLDKIVENCPISAWGKKTGDRIIADVLVYAPPPPVQSARP